MIIVYGTDSLVSDKDIKGTYKYLAKFKSEAAALEYRKYNDFDFNFCVLYDEENEQSIYNNSDTER